MCDISDDTLYRDVDGLPSCRILKQPAAVAVLCPPVKTVRTVRFAPLPQESLQTRSTWCPATPPTVSALSPTHRSTQNQSVSPFMDLLQKHKSTQPTPDPPSNIAAATSPNPSRLRSSQHKTSTRLGRMPDMVAGASFLATPGEKASRLPTEIVGPLSRPALAPETGSPMTMTPATGAENCAAVPENLSLTSASVTQSAPPIASSVSGSQSRTTIASVLPPSAGVAASETATLLLQQRPDFATIRSSPLWPTLRLLSDNAWAAFVHMHSTLLGDAYMTVEADRRARHHETELKEREHQTSLASCRTELQRAKSEVEKMTDELAARDRLLDRTRADATKLGAEGEARRVRDTDVLRAQISKLETELHDARNENVVVRSEIAAVRSENKGLREEQRRLRELVSKLEAKVSWLLFGRAGEADTA